MIEPRRIYTQMVLREITTTTLVLVNYSLIIDSCFCIVRVALEAVNTVNVRILVNQIFAGLEIKGNCQNIDYFLLSLYMCKIQSFRKYN